MPEILLRSHRGRAPSPEEVTPDDQAAFGLPGCASPRAPGSRASTGASSASSQITRTMPVLSEVGNRNDMSPPPSRRQVKTEHEVVLPGRHRADELHARVPVGLEMAIGVGLVHHQRLEPVRQRDTTFSGSQLTSP